MITNLGACGQTRISTLHSFRDTNRTVLHNTKKNNHTVVTVAAQRDFSDETTIQSVTDNCLILSEAGFKFELAAGPVNSCLLKYFTT